MSRRGTRPWGPGEGDDVVRPPAEGRPWGGGAAVDLPGAAGAGESSRPFGGIGWHEAPPVPEPADDLADEFDESGSDRPRDGSRRKRGREEPTHPRKPLAALGATVRVVRDEHGLAHVAAKSERDAWAALGWCMATDRPREMDLARRLAHGRAAEVLGQAFVAHDALVRTAGVPRRAALAASRLPGAAHDVISSFAAGVNAAFAEPGADEPATRVIEPWTIADTLAIEVLLALATSLRTWPTKLVVGRLAATCGIERARWIAGDLPPRLPLDSRREAWSALDLAIADLVAGLPVDVATDVTAWAVASPGEATLDAVLYASPGLPGTFYEARLSAPGFEVVGCAPLGVPAFHVGRTRDVAWAGVPARVDDCDVVLEELDGIGNRRTPSGWEKLATRHETIRVRDAEAVSIEVAETRRGPLVSHLARQLAGREADPREPAVALHWGACTVFSSVQAWSGLARAGDVAGAMRAAEAFERATQPVRLVLADRSGRVATRVAGSVPVREANFRLPLLGWTGEGAWTSVRSVADGPATAEAGTRSDVVAACGDGAYGGPGASTSCPRLRRFPEVARSSSACGSGTALDAVDPVLRDLVPCLRAALAASEEPGTAELTAEFASFDGEIRPADRAAAVAIAAVYHFLPRDLFPAATFGPLASFPRLALPVVERILLAPTSPWFADPGARDRAVAAALLSASAWLGQAESAGGRRACEALFRSPGDEVSGGGAEDPSGLRGRPFPGCGTPSVLAMLDWHGQAPPFAVTLAPALRAGCSLSADHMLLASPVEPDGSGGHPSHDRAPGLAPGQAHAIDLGSPAEGEIVDLVAG